MKLRKVRERYGQTCQFLFRGAGMGVAVTQPGRAAKEWALRNELSQRRMPPT